ncbi:MAG: TRAP transporter substrate-binding protein DctP [Synergistes jonesii]|uniref:TRAP transporter substrate-binding protein DctP n=1 Tax=Synergistes jonesii TaxID=2754 RepID=UPI002A750DDF|nr:TRAP transporter substrate-binding protein DctP [Synergistes jonesii]MDY2985196.1 TRAP transporter substrate-binding protein DctP [Synergistes jonesii]
MKKFALVLAAVFLFVAVVGPATAAPVVFRFAGQSPPDHMATKTMEAMAKEIKEGTKGRVEIKVYPASQLGNYTLVMEEMIRGTIDMACMSLATDFDPRLEIIYTNGFVTGYDSAKKALVPGAWLPNKLNSFLNEVGVHLLGSYVEGFIGIGSSKPVKDPLNPKVDKGVLTRVPNMVVYTAGAKAMGYRPITIPYPDVYQSMQTGVCDAVDGYPTAAAYTILGDVLKYWYATNYSMEYLGYMVSDKSWKKLSPEDQKVFKDVCRKYTLASIDNAKSEDDKYMDLMEKKGIKVFKYSEAELKPIKEACVSTWEEVGKAGTGVELMKEFKKELGNL